MPQAKLYKCLFGAFLSKYGSYFRDFNIRIRIKASAVVNSND